MTKITCAMFGILALALATGGCDSKAEPAETKTADDGQARRPSRRSTTPRPPPPPAKPAPERVLADSGLGVGGKFQAFDIVNCDSGDEYCQVCKFGGSPKIMAVGTIDDPEFQERPARTSTPWSRSTARTS
jgi:hypothetical protein